MANEDERLCLLPTCAKPLTRREGERHWLWRKRVTCGRECDMLLRGWLKQELFRRTIEEHAPCPMCGRPFTPNPKENVAQYRVRTFCSRGCATSHGWQAGVHNHKIKAHRTTKRRIKVPVTSSQTIEEFIAAGGIITQCPTKFVARTHVLSEDEQASRIARLKVPRETVGWQPLSFGKGAAR